ncbi:hypothetical protein [Anaerocolumna jejuensis]
MKKIKRLIILIIFVLLFGMLHRYTEWKFSNDPPKGVIEQLEDWVGELGH